MFELLNTANEIDDSHYEQDRNALKRKEWERRSQEVQQDEDLFASGFSLFGEPYKTNKGDALASRLQDTLGNYDEMKDLLTNHSNQSQLVGIPKNSVPQTPTEKNEPSFFPEQRNRMIAPHQGGSYSATSVPPSTSVTSSSNVLHGHQNIRKPRADWPRAGHSSTITQSSQSTGQPNRMKHSSFHDQPQGRYEDLFSCPSEQPPNGGMEDASSTTTASSNSRRLSHSKSSGGEPSYKESIQCPSPIDFEFLANGPISPLPSTSLLSAASSLTIQNFSQGLYCKTSMIQQKPTAYVRPMDGQEQLPDFPPTLKPMLEIESGYSSQTFGTLLEGKPSATTSKTKLPKFTISQPSEVNSGIEIHWEILAAALRLHCESLTLLSMDKKCPISCTCDCLHLSNGPSSSRGERGLGLGLKTWGITSKDGYLLLLRKLCTYSLFSSRESASKKTNRWNCIGFFWIRSALGCLINLSSDPSCVEEILRSYKHRSQTFPILDGDLHEALRPPIRHPSEMMPSGDEHLYLVPKQLKHSSSMELYLKPLRAW
ncbi:AF4/FMR2 family member 2-like [Petaurus breviceps papuanus]|uniref:AF4/FMR2 family member 2-like n=1 Tax=Petaurus breviceps papuanus TaxID=3040969 RepID=UPI0036D8EEFB